MHLRFGYRDFTIKATIAEPAGRTDTVQRTLRAVSLTGDWGYWDSHNHSPRLFLDFGYRVFERQYPIEKSFAHLRWWNSISMNDNKTFVDGDSPVRAKQNGSVDIASNVYTLDPVMPRRKYSFWIDDEQAQGRNW